MKTSRSAVAQYDANENDRISRSQVWNHRLPPRPQEHSAYALMRDANEDRVVCES